MLLLTPLPCHASAALYIYVATRRLLRCRCLRQFNAADIAAAVCHIFADAADALRHAAAFMLPPCCPLLRHDALITIAYIFMPLRRCCRAIIFAAAAMLPLSPLIAILPMPYAASFAADVAFSLISLLMLFSPAAARLPCRHFPLRRRLPLRAAFTPCCCLLLRYMFIARHAY